MDLETFRNSLDENEPPAGVSAYLQSMWYDAKGDWNKAHIIIQDIEDETASWIHAFLHRKEGDIFNADYWYRRAGRTRPGVTLSQEWESITDTLLKNR